MSACDEYDKNRDAFKLTDQAPTQTQLSEFANLYHVCNFSDISISDATAQGAARQIVTDFSKKGVDPDTVETIKQQLLTLGERKAVPNNESAQSKHHGADPVMMFNGQFVHDATDITINGAGIVFTFTRTYKNQVPFNGPLGFNWTHNFHIWLRVANETIFRTTGDMREEAFTKHPKFEEATDDHFKYWIPPDGKDGVILPEGNSFVLRLPDGVRYIFESDPAHSFLHRLIEIRDRHGNYITLDYRPSDNLLHQIFVNHRQRVVTFEYDDQQRIHTVYDFMGRVWHYAYDSIGDLIAVTTPAPDPDSCARTVRYDYSSAFFTGELQHNLIRIIDAAGQIYLENEYGTGAGLLNFNRVVRQRQGGGEFRFEYEDFLEPLDFDYPDEQRPVHVTILVERNGQPVHHIYNKFGNLLRREQRILQDGLPHNLVEHYRYNRDGNIVASLSPEGVLTQHLYGRDYFLRHNPLTPNGEVPTKDLTWRERQGFGRVRATVRRDGYSGLLGFNISQGIFGNFPDIIDGVFPPDMGERKNDIIIKMTYEDEFGQLKTVSDPRFTKSADPNDNNEHRRYQETLTEYIYGQLFPQDPLNRFLLSIKRPTPTLPDESVGEDIVEEFSYDSHGRLLQHKNPIDIITEYTYFPKDPTAPLQEGYLQRTIVDPSGLAITTEYTVDDLGRVVATTLPRSGESADGRFVTRTRYNNLDQVVETTSSKPFAFRTHHFYDLNGKLERQVREVKDENGDEILGGRQIHTYCYDEEFNLLEETIGGIDLESHLVTKHRYNAAGQRALTVLPEENQIQYRYDERRLLIAITRGVCTEDESTIRTKYDGDGRVRRTIDARGNSTNFTWDAFGREIAQEDALGHITVSSYDKAGNLICTRVFEKRTEGYFLLVRSETEFDELNRAIRSSVNRFDEPLGPNQRSDLKTKFLESPGPGKLLTTQTFYDAKGRVERTLDPLLREHKFTYDALDRVVIATDPLGNETRNRYDVHGNLVRRDQIDLVYDKDGNVAGQRVFSSESSYDELDRVISSVDSLGNITYYFYDSRGNRVRQVDPLGNVIRTEYDIFNRRSSIHQELTDNGLGSGKVQDTATTSYEYDRNGNQLSMVDALGRRTAFSYDALDRKRATVYPDKSEFLFDYDKDGNVIRTTDNNGLKRLFTVDPLGRTTRVDVDKSGLTTGVTVEGATFERYQYDGLDRCIFEKNDFANRTIRHNSLGWLISETIAFTTPAAPLVTRLEVIRGFDDVGALTDLTYPNGRKVHFDRDDLNRLTSIQNVLKGADYPGNVATPDTYDVVTKIEYAGRQRQRCLYGNGAAIGYSHDGAGRLIEISHTSPARSMLTLQYLFDAVSNARTRHDIDPTHNAAEKFSFDSFYRLADEGTENRSVFDPTLLAPAESIPSSPIPNRQADLDNLIGSLELPPDQRTYSYDLVGNRKSEQFPDGTLVKYGVNELDQYSSRNGTTFSYEKNGTLKGDGQYSYFYDSLDRLTRVEDTSSHEIVMQFFHDARGRRVLEVSDSLATHLIWSGDNQIAEYRNGILFALYVFDDGVDRPLQIAAAGADQWYHPDLVGSVRLLTDQIGNKNVSYRYTPFGMMLEETNNQTYNPLLYTARRFDVHLGTYDFRARQYVPSLGKFIQRDPKGHIDGPNLYTYARNLPLTMIDPYGTDSRPELDRVLDYFSPLSKLTGLFSPPENTFSLGSNLPEFNAPLLQYDDPGIMPTVAAAAGKAVVSLPGWMNSALMWSNRLGKYGLTRRIADRVSTLHMQSIFFLDRFKSGREIWKQSYQHAPLKTMTSGTAPLTNTLYRRSLLRSLNRKSGTAGLVNLGLHAVGAPEEVTDPVGLVAEANAPAAVFEGILALGSFGESIYSNDADWDTVGNELRFRSLSGRHGTIIQGYEMLTTILIGRDWQKELMLKQIQYDEAGYAPNLGKRVSGLIQKLPWWARPDVFQRMDVSNGDWYDRIQKWSREKPDSIWDMVWD